ncbi:MAG: IS66 family transposase [Acidimicrobiales bacterium]
MVSSDFYAVYQSLSRLDGVDTLWCFSHIRRYFIRAGDADEGLGPWRDAWLGGFAALYRAHHALRPADPGTDAAADAEADFTLALDEIDLARKKESLDDDLPPAARKVLATLNNEWEGSSVTPSILCYASTTTAGSASSGTLSSGARTTKWLALPHAQQPSRRHHLGDFHVFHSPTQRLSLADALVDLQGFLPPHVQSPGIGRFGPGRQPWIRPNRTGPATIPPFQVEAAKLS